MQHPVFSIRQKLIFQLRFINSKVVLFYSCSMGMSSLHEVYTQSLRAQPVDCGHTFRQTTSACVIAIILHF